MNILFKHVYWHKQLCAYLRELMKCLLAIFTLFTQTPKDTYLDKQLGLPPSINNL